MEVSFLVQFIDITLGKFKIQLDIKCSKTFEIILIQLENQHVLNCGLDYKQFLYSNINL